MVKCDSIHTNNTDKLYTEHQRHMVKRDSIHTNTQRSANSTQKTKDKPYVFGFLCRVCRSLFNHDSQMFNHDGQRFKHDNQRFNNDSQRTQRSATLHRKPKTYG
jgi:hypothetical protein